LAPLSETAVAAAAAAAADVLALPPLPPSPRFVESVPPGLLLAADALPVEAGPGEDEVVTEDEVAVVTEEVVADRLPLLLPLFGVLVVVVVSSSRDALPLPVPQRPVGVVRCCCCCCCDAVGGGVVALPSVLLLRVVLRPLGVPVLATAVLLLLWLGALVAVLLPLLLTPGEDEADFSSADDDDDAADDDAADGGGLSTS